MSALKMLRSQRTRKRKIYCILHEHYDNEIHECTVCKGDIGSIVEVSWRNLRILYCDLEVVEALRHDT